MHQTRSEIIRKLPLPRKGTKYVAVALRSNSKSIPIVVAIRDLLKLASTSKEVKSMIHNKLIKINGKPAKDINDPINLFSIMEADKSYILTLLETGRFSLEETKEKDRKLKITGKRKVRNGVLQYSLHDGTSLVSDQSFSVGDTLVLSKDNKVMKHLSFDNGKEIFVLSGSNIGKKGKIRKLIEKKISVEFDKNNVILDKEQVILI